MDYISSVITLQIKNKAVQKTVPGKVPVYSMTHKKYLFPLTPNFFGQRWTCANNLEQQSSFLAAVREC